MKLLLIKPYNVSDHIQPSLGLGYLATNVRKNHQVEILDCIKLKLNIDGVIKYVTEKSPDVVGFQFYTYDFNFIKNTAEKIKKQKPQIIIIAGGPHPSVAGKEVMKQIGAIDFVFQGEAEKSLPKFMDIVHSGKKIFSEVDGLIWKNGNDIICNQPKFCENPDELELPAWDLIHPETYPEAQHGAFFKRFPIAPIITTRGCPFSCTFCSAHKLMGKKLRLRSAESVVDEIKILHQTYGIKEIHIVDDNFTLDREHAKNILRKLKESKLKISWAVPNGIRLGTLDEELLVLMKDTGCYLISVGIESGSDRILKQIKKNLTVETIKKEVNFIRSFGFDIAGFFIVGFPSENEEDIKKTIALSTALPLIRANFFTFLPLPGTEAYLQLEREGELKNVDWNRFLFTSAPYIPRSLTRKKLKSLQREAFFRFFFRPKIMIRNLLSIKSFKHFKFLVRRVWNWMT